MDMSNFDNFQKQKAILNKHLANITASVNEMNDLKKKRGGMRDPQIIGMQAENYKALKVAEQMWSKLKEAFERNVKKNKLDPKTLEDRRKFVELFGREMIKLQEQNSGIKRQAGSDTADQAIANNQKRAAARAARRAGRRDRRTAARTAAGGSGTDDVEMDDVETKQPISAQEQQFYMEVQENDKKMDVLLDVINQGLQDLKNMATDIGTNLDTQAKMLEEVDQKMDDTLENFQTANARLRQLMEENTGGVETWCPIIILIIVLLAIVGYIFSIV